MRVLIIKKKKKGERKKKKKDPEFLRIIKIRALVLKITNIMTAEYHL